MAHLGRMVKAEAPRPLKSQSRSSLKSNLMVIEELIQLIENVALTLQSGINNTEPMTLLAQNLRIHGPQLESVSKDTLDRAFVVFRNASQDERLNIMTRLHLLELIELRAKGWEDNGFNSYYKTKQATNAEIPEQQFIDSPAAFLSTSPSFGGGGAGGIITAAMVGVGSAQQQTLMLGPGEVIRSSGQFPKPTKIPGKTYCKDEVVIRNADSGRVMGIKGRRVHMIEELSETIISFQKVNPGAKERLVQITGPTEEKIIYAKQLIEDTIRRNASPVRLENAGGVLPGGGSCSSLASSNSDEAVPRTPNAASGGNLTNRLSFNSAQHFMTASTAAQQSSIPQTGLKHTFPTNELGEYKYTVNVGQHVIKITGDCCGLVKAAKLVLDDYFSRGEFVSSAEAEANFEGMSPISTPSTPMGQPQFIMGTSLQAAPPLADSGIGLNYMASQASNNAQDGGEDDVFVEGNTITTSASQSNGLARSRRSHFSRRNTAPDATKTATPTQPIVRIIHQLEHLLYYAKSPHSWALPADWKRICEEFPMLIRNQVNELPKLTMPVLTKTGIRTTMSSISSTSTNLINHAIIANNSNTNSNCNGSNNYSNNCTNSVTTITKTTAIATATRNNTNSYNNNHFNGNGNEDGGGGHKNQFHSHMNKTVIKSKPIVFGHGNYINSNLQQQQQQQQQTQ